MGRGENFATLFLFAYFHLPLPHSSCDLFLLLAVFLSENSFIGMEREIDDGRVCTFWGVLFGCGS